MLIPGISSLMRRSSFCALDLNTPQLLQRSISTCFPPPPLAPAAGDFEAALVVFFLAVVFLAVFFTASDAEEEEEEEPRARVLFRVAMASNAPSLSLSLSLFKSCSASRISFQN